MLKSYHFTIYVYFKGKLLAT